MYMKGYIYQIVNKETGERYVGKTIDIIRREARHYQALKKGLHANSKLQNGWNKYGEEKFDFVVDTYEIQDEKELNQLEIDTIAKYDSYYNGYNLTLGGDGGDTRSKLTYEQYCLVYLGCQWQGLTPQIGKYLNVDSACISGILREKSYLFFKKRADEESNDVKKYYQELFRKTFGIPENKKPDEQRVPSHLSEDEYFYCLCVASNYSRGIEQALANFFGKHKSFLSNGMKSAKQQGKAYCAKQRFLKLSVEEIRKIAREKFEEWNLQDWANSKLHEDFNNKWRQ